MSRRVVVLALLVALVGGWLLFIEIPSKNREDEKALAERFVFYGAPAVIDTVRIRQADREILVARDSADSSRWMLLSPIREEIPVASARDLIDQIRVTERWRRLPVEGGDVDWRLYGLAGDSPARVRIELIGEGGKVGADIGLLTDGAKTAWLRRVGSDELELVFDSIYEIANASHHGLRDPRLFEVKPDELVRMRFVTDARTWQAVRDEEGLWHLGAVDGPRLKRWVLEDVAFAVAGLRADGYDRDFLEGDDWLAYGLGRPWGKVEWEAADGRTGWAHFGNEVDSGVVYGRRSGLDSVFRIAPGLGPALDADLDAWLDLNPIGGNFLRMEYIRLHRDDGYLDIVRETPGVRLEDQDGPLEAGEYSQVAGRNVQLGLEEVQPLAEMFVARGQDPASLLDPVEARLTLHWPDRELEVLLGLRGDETWMAIEGETMLWQVPRDLLLRVREAMEL